MKKRLHVLVSILLALSMLLSLNVVTFAQTAEPSAQAATEGQLLIKSVEVVTGGQVQAHYNNSASSVNPHKVWKGDDGKYYTSSRTASFTDARIFNLEYVVPTGKSINLNDVTLTYDGKTIETRETGGALTRQDVVPGTGDKALVYLLTSPASVITDGKQVITAQVYFNTILDPSTATPLSGSNIPYEGYARLMRTASSGINRLIGINKWMKAKYGAKDPEINLALNEKGSLISSGAVINVPYNVYDDFRTWKQIDQRLADIQGQIRDRSFFKDEANKDSGRYAKVYPIGQSTSGANTLYHAVLAKSENDVTTYENVTKPKLMTNPASITADDKLVIMFNNVHPNETAGTDSILKLFEDLAKYDTASFYSLNEGATTRVVKSHGYGDALNFTNYSGSKDDQVMPTNRKTETLDVNALLDKYIIVFSFTSNPDGRDNMDRVNRYNFDLNRDASLQTQIESQLMTAEIARWEPVSFIEYHGEVAEMLIEPCTPPFEPNFEMDLYENEFADKSINAELLGRKIGDAILASTPINSYFMPKTDAKDGWDAGSSVYSPQYAMLLGAVAFTIEIPDSTRMSMDATYTCSLASLKDAVDRAAIYKAFKKEYKRRNIENLDVRSVDKYFVDPYTNTAVGRPRAGRSSFFPDYHVIPVDVDNQRNISEAYKTLKQLDRNGVALEQTTTDMVVNGSYLPAGTYVVNMKQANRSYANNMLGDGYDASNFADMYANIFTSMNRLRNFDDIILYDKAGFFNGSTTKVTNIGLPAAQTAHITTDKVIIKNDGVDAIRLVNKLLNDGKSVSMMTKNLGSGYKGDFVANKADLSPEMTGGLVLQFSPYDYVDPNAVPLKQPKISMSETQFSTSGYNTGYARQQSAYALDHMGFVENKNYQYGGIDAMSGANVVLINSDIDVSSKVNSGVGVVAVNSGAVNGLFKAGRVLNGKGFENVDNLGAPNSGAFDGMMRADYNNNNLVSASYTASGRENALLSYGANFFTTLPADGSATVLANVVNSEDNFIGGWFRQPERARGKAWAVATTVKNGDKTSVITMFAQNIFDKAYQRYTYNMLANAIFMGAAGVDPQVAPVAEGSLATTSATYATLKMAFTGKDYAFTPSKYVWEKRINNAWVVAGTTSKPEFEITGLTESTRYALRVTVFNGNDPYATYNTFATTPKKPSKDRDNGSSGGSTGGGGTTTGGTTTGGTTTTPKAESEVKVDLDKTTTTNGTATITLAPGANGAAAVVIPMGDKLNQMVANNEQFAIKAETPQGSYLLPASLETLVPDLANILEAAGVNANDVSIKLTIADITADKAVNNEIATAMPDAEVVGFILSFEIEIVDKDGKTIAGLNNFNVRVERTINLDGATLPVGGNWGAYRINDKTGKPEFVAHKLVDNGKGVGIKSKSNSVYFVANNPVSFDDITADFWASSYIERAASKRLVAGMDANNYMPNKAVSRAEFLQMIAPALQLPVAASDEAPYTDVTQAAWYYDIVANAKAAGLLDCFTGTTFNGNTPITREEMACVLAAAVQYEQGVEMAKAPALDSVFTDADMISEDLADEVAFIYSLKIMQGMGNGTFAPQETSTRAQAATVMIVTLKYLDLID